MSLRFGRAAAIALAGFGILASAACGRDGEPVRERRTAAAAPPPEPSFAPVSAEQLVAATQAGRNWLVHGGAYSNQRYSALDRITRENVGRLTPAWIYETGIAESFDTTPIVANGVMYLTTAESRVVALDAATGEELWTFVPRIEPVPLCCGPVNRGVAILGNLVFVGTLDAHLIALDNRTGQPVWDTPLADPEEGYSITMAPLAFDSTVVVGVSGGEYGIRGFVAALDARTGKERWRWHTIPAPGEAPNGWWGEWRDSDPFGMPLPRDIAAEKEDVPRYPQTWRVGGGGVEMTPAYDPATATLFLSVGSPAPVLDGSVRPGDNLYTGSVVALDARSGKLRWYFQEVPHDLWDLSPTSPPFLFDAGGRTLLAQAGNTGWLYVVDAANGNPVLRSDNFLPQENLFVPPTEQGTRMAPGADGGAGTSAAAFSPRTGYAYVLGIHDPMVFTVRPGTDRTEGNLWLAGSFRRLPGQDRWATLAAIDLASGDIAWQLRFSRPTFGAPLATAGDLVFVGQADGRFEAFDAVDGRRLWSYRTGSGVHGGPVTYLIGETQYVAVASGGNYHLNTRRGDNVIAFTLHDNAPAQTPARYEAPGFPRAGPLRPGAARQLPAQPRARPDAGGAGDTAGGGGATRDTAGAGGGQGRANVDPGVP